MPLLYINLQSTVSRVWLSNYMAERKIVEMFLLWIFLLSVNTVKTLWAYGEIVFPLYLPRFLFVLLYLIIHLSSPSVHLSHITHIRCLIIIVLPLRLRAKPWIVIVVFYGNSWEFEVFQRMKYSVCIFPLFLLFIVIICMVILIFVHSVVMSVLGAQIPYEWTYQQQQQQQQWN